MRLWKREMEGSSNVISDYWWLPKGVSINNLRTGVGYHKNVTDGDEVPPLSDWYRSLDSKGRLSTSIETYPIIFVEKWRVICKNTNVYRTLEVFGRRTGEAILLGPFVVDIDNSGGNLSEAQNITRQIVDYLVNKLSLLPNKLRVFFSGHKGFNVEVHPEAIGLRGVLIDQIKLSSLRLRDITDFLRNSNNIKDSCMNVVGVQGTVIDQIYGDRLGYKLKHSYIRLHSSINKWSQKDGLPWARRKIEITIEQLWEMNTTQVSAESEKQTLTS